MSLYNKGFSLLSGRKLSYAERESLTPRKRSISKEYDHPSKVSQRVIHTSAAIARMTINPKPVFPDYQIKSVASSHRHHRFMSFKGLNHENDSKI